MSKRLSGAEYTKLATDIERDHWSPLSDTAMAFALAHRKFVNRIWIVLTGLCLLALLVFAAVSHQRDADRQNEQFDNARHAYCVSLGGQAARDCLAGL